MTAPQSAEGPQPTYLGDSVYAEFDGWFIKLLANGGSEVIFIEPRVFKALLQYALACGVYVPAVTP